MIKKSTVKKIIVHRVLCDECGGPMNCMAVLPTAPPQYRYKCPECGYEEVSFTRQGAFQYVFDDGEEAEDEI